MSKSVTKDGVSYATGAVRSADREGVRYDLITPIGLRRLAETCHEGAVKYSDFNWERGMPIADLANHAIAHLYAYLSGDRSEDHLAHAAWNCLGACHSEEQWPELNQSLRGEGCRPPQINNDFESSIEAVLSSHHRAGEASGSDVDGCCAAGDRATDTSDPYWGYEICCGGGP
jgi:hypothetical protein